MRAPEARSAPPRTTLHAVEGVARRLVLLVAPIWLLPVLATSLAPTSTWQRTDVTVALVVVALGYLAFWKLGQPVAMVTALSVASAWLALHDPAAQGLTTQDLILEQWVNLSAWVAGILIARTRVSAAVVVGGVVCVVLVLVAQQPALTNDDLAALVAYGLTDGLAAVAAFGVMRRSARATDTQIERRLRTAEALESQRARQRESRRIARLMHDTVINTLCAVQLWEHTDPALLRERAQADLSLLHALEPATTTASKVVTDLCRQRASLLGLELECHEPEGLPELPADVAAALQGACWEALTNVAKHSNARRATLTWTRSGHAISLEISDDGVGFDTGRPRVGGMAESIHARCAEVGVMATIASQPGGGTTVRLVWGPEQTNPTPPAQPSAPPFERDLATSVGWIAAALGLFCLGALLRLGVGAAHTWFGLAGFTVVILVALATGAVLRRGAVIRPPVLLYVVAGLLVVAAPSFGIHGCARVGTWWWGPFGGILLGAYAAILDARTRAVVATVVGTGLGYLAAVATIVDGTDKCRQDTLAFLVLQSGLIVALGSARKRHAQIYDAGTRAMHAAELDRVSMAREAATQRSRQRHFAYAQTVAAPVLAGLADGHLNPTDASARFAAEAAESAMRLLATLDASGPGSVGSVLATSVVAAHERGVRLHVSLVNTALMHARASRGLPAALQEFVAACPAGSSAQLTFLDDQPGIRVLAVIRGHATEQQEIQLRESGWTVTAVEGDLLLEQVLGEHR